MSIRAWSAGSLLVEHAEGVGFGAALVVLAHLVLDGRESFAQGGVVALRSSVEPTELSWSCQLRMPSSSSSEASISSTSASRRGDSEPDVVRAENLAADLPELAVAAALGALAAELRADVEQLLQLAGLAELVLDVGANHAGGVFRAEGQGLRGF